MTIDEAIEYELNGNVIPPTKYIQTYREQLVEWLEELKHYKLGECMNDCEHYDNCSNYIYSKGYDKAIDDFAEKLCNEVESFTATVDGVELDFVSLDYLIEFAYEVSKQLKSRTEL